ncbi:MAG: WD40 repeat domain-containing protein [Rhodospirillales bacterium]|jgi:hypothetical protein|nr:WD40 repeat domain-containing protein [Rhodospirillales bacterium]
MTSLATRMTATAALILLAACNPATMGGSLLGNSTAPAPQVQAQQAQAPKTQAPVSQRKVDLAQYVSEAPIAEAVFSADGTVLATVHKRAEAPYLGVWDLTKPDAPAIRTAKLGTGGGLGKSFILSPDGRHITLRRGEKDELALVDLATYRTVRPLKLGFPRDQIQAGAFSPDGRTLAVVRQFFAGGMFADHALHLVDIESGSVRASENLQKNYVKWLNYAPDGRSILAGIERNRVVPRDLISDELNHISDGAILFDATSLTQTATFGMGDGTRYSWLSGGRVLPGNHAMALIEGSRKVSIVSLPGGALQQDLTGKYNERFAHMAFADDSTIGIAAVENNTAGRLWIGYVDGEKTYALRNHPLNADLPLDLAVSKVGEWLVATAQGLRRFPALPPHAGRAARAMAEARELAKAGFPEEAYALLDPALDDDWRVVRRNGMDIVLAHSPLLAGQLELKRWRLMQAEGEADAVWPLFGFGYLAVQAGHPHVVAQAAAELRRAGDLGTALAGYLDALVLAARGDVDGGYKLAIAAKRGLGTADLEILAGRVKDHAEAWQPLYADRTKLGFVIGIGEKDLPKTPQRSVAMTPYIDIDGNRVGPGAAPPAARSPAPAPTPAPSTATTAPAAGPVVLE